VAFPGTFKTPLAVTPEPMVKLGKSFAEVAMSTTQFKK
jgi:hypothetical protein